MRHIQMVTIVIVCNEYNYKNIIFKMSYILYYTYSKMCNIENKS